MTPTCVETSTVVIAEETVATVWDDLQPLLVKHWQEISAYLDIPLKVNKGFYEQAEAGGHLCVVTARKTGVLVGYAVFCLGESPHYAGSIQAKQDVFYVEPSARKGMAKIGMRLLSRADAILRARGVQVVYHHVKLAHPVLGLLLEHDGYLPQETIYAKRLDKDDV